jgi:hypothetical protein
MISDILHKAIGDIDYYLNDSFWDGVYSGELRERMIRLREEAESIRAVLDTPPGDTLPAETARQNG